jgi:hypothetical protein
VPPPTIDGIIAYPVTPYAETGGIDTARLAELVDRLITGRVHAIAPLGSTGELAYLEEPEFDAVVDTTIDTVAERVPVIVGVSDLTTAKTIRRAEYAQQAGADAVMILPVSYWTLTQVRRPGECADPLRQPQAAVGVHRRGWTGHHCEGRAGPAWFPDRGPAGAAAAARRAEPGRAAGATVPELARLNRGWSRRRCRTGAGRHSDSRR